MGIVSVEIGLVGTGDDLIGFYEAVLGGTRREPKVFPFATVHLLDLGPVVLKVMVPTVVPRPAPSADHFSDVAGLRYVTLWVDDLAALVERWTTAGGRVTTAPYDLRPRRALRAPRRSRCQRRGGAATVVMGRGARRAHPGAVNSTAWPRSR